MRIGTYVRLWLICTMILAFECFALNRAPEYSILRLFQTDGYLRKGLDLTPEPGKFVSLGLGWLGIGTMLLTNLYIFRKRLYFMRNWGKISGWLNFHIFCGLLGPTFILFHTNFKIGGLVAISFWSMVVSFSSGVVGRYFYIQIVGQKADLEKELARCNERVIYYSRGVNEQLMKQRRVSVMALAGVPSEMQSEMAPVLQSVMSSMWGDLRLRFGMGGATSDLSFECRWALVDYAVTQRRIRYLEQFRTVMGYWHSFHMPFAVFMYAIAAIHIAAALLLQV